MDLSTNWLIESSTDPEVVRLIEKSRTHSDGLEETELIQIQRLTRSWLLRLQSAFLHWRRGSIGAAEWQSYEFFVCQSLGLFGSEITARLWPEERLRLAEEFVAYIEACNTVFEPPN